MPWPGNDADDDAPGDPGGLRRPPPPDDRLWRHPSELAWPAPVAPTATATSGGRVWTVALVSGLTGAVLTLGLVAAVTGFGSVTERVVERVPVSLPVGIAGSTARALTVPAIASAVGPSVVRLDVATEGGAVTGSGVVLRDDGTIVTNAHLVDGSTGLMIVLADGTAVPGVVTGSDPVTDIAVVRPESGGAGVVWEPAVVGDRAELEVGETAITIGSPLGPAVGPAVTVGVVSALGQRVSGDGFVLHGLIQTDASIAVVSSGGALCDGSGVVVGITTALGADSGSQGFAIPVEVVRTVAEQLLGRGDVDHAWLGIEGADLLPTDASEPGTTGTDGVRVLDVDAGGPASVAGLEPGDVVVGLDGHRVRSMSDLIAALRTLEPGSTVTVELRRGDEAMTVEVVLGER